MHPLNHLSQQVNLTQEGKRKKERKLLGLEPEELHPCEFFEGVV